MVVYCRSDAFINSLRIYEILYLALLRHLALNLLTQDNETKRGIAARRKKAAWDDSYLVKILTQ
jgi:hypothetical protein